MGSLSRIKLRSFYIRAASWEYWPMWLVYFPVSFYYIFLSMKARSFFFFSAANPSIETGGMFFESKWNIFKLIPKQFYPATVLINGSDEAEIISTKMQEVGLEFPVIAKPDRGERGWCVKKISTANELASYKAAIHVDFLVQAYVDHPLEFSIFYYRHPTSDKGNITSVTLKKLLTITGDGQATVDELVKRNNRALLQYPKLKQDRRINFDRVLARGEAEVLVPYGNHVLGARFVDFGHIIDESLVNTFDQISKQIDGFYFGRYDLRCTSIEDLKMGKNIAILELNGAGAEPAHIYDPRFSFFKAQRVIANHYRMMYDAAAANKQAGIPFMTFSSFKKTRKLEQAYKRSVHFAAL